MTRAPFISSTEALLLVTNHANGFYIPETDILPKRYETAKEAIEGQDDFIRAIRLDLVGLKAEDVTEDCAKAWLKDFEGDPDSKVPDFVKRSEAYDDWCHDYEAENPRWRGVDPDEAYDRRRDEQMMGAA